MEPNPASTGVTPPGEQPGVCEAAPKPPSPIALLTRTQYDNTVEDLLGDTTRPSTTFPAENQVEGFRNNVYAHQASPLLVEMFQGAAESIAARAVSTRLDTLAPCAAGADAVACGRSFVRSFGMRAFRRPLLDDEAQIFDGLFERSLANEGYAGAVELVLTAMLQSPQFLYRIDSIGTPTPETGAVAFGPYEMASRLSYFLTGSMPDAELFEAAAANRLATDEEIETQARRLIATPRARQMVREFHHQWLRLDNLPALMRTASELGAGSTELGRDWLASLDAFVDHVYWEAGNASALFTSKRVYVTPRLAVLYETSASANGLTAVELPDRAGLITQPALLALLAHPDQSAPVLRGVFVRERLMCLPVPPPPPTVNNMPPDPDPNATTRERFRVHTESDECRACHQLIDGVGFGLEAYDQLGRYRSEENGLPVDVSGEVFGTGDPELDGVYSGAGELAARLAGSRRVADCIATSWYQYAVGRTPAEADACSLAQVTAAFERSKGDLRELLVAVTLTDGFRYRAPLPEEAP